MRDLQTDFVRALAKFCWWIGLRRRAVRSSIKLMVANKLNKGIGGESGVGGRGKGVLRDLRTWNCVSDILRSAAAERER